MNTTLLTVCGYVHRQTVPASWKDIGGPESGPKLHGHNEFEVWAHPDDPLYDVCFEPNDPKSVERLYNYSDISIDQVF